MRPERSRLLLMLSLAGIGVGAALVGLVVGGQGLPWDRSEPPLGARMASAAPVTSERPAVVFPTGQNAVTVTERRVPARDLLQAREEETDISTSIQNDPEPPSRVESEPIDDSRPRSKHEPPTESTLVPPAPETEAPPADGAAPGATTNDERPTTNEEGESGKRGAGDKPTTNNQQPITPTDGSPRLFRVRVGHFADEKDAQALGDELKKDGYAPAVVRTEQGGQVLYRVQVGTYRQRENADKAIETLRKREFVPDLAEE